MNRLLKIACTLLSLLPGSMSLAQPAAPGNSITPVTDSIYMASAGNWHTVFLVTSEGIVLADPLNVPFANWLHDELDERFDVPVRYVIYSHSHYDHIEGGDVFRDTATFIAQEGMLRNMDGRFPHMPGGFVDLNTNGMFEREEVRDRNAFPDYNGVCGSRFFDTRDLNGDDHLTMEEYYADIVPPDITYSDSMTLTLGGHEVQLVYPGKNHANDGTVIYFPQQKVAFSSDFPADALVSTSMHSLPSACGYYDFHPASEWIKSFKSIEALDFDILVQGHGSVLFEKQDVVDARLFFEDLLSAVDSAMRAGMSLEEMKENILLEAYSDWGWYDRLREDNIEAMYFNLINYR